MNVLLEMFGLVGLMFGSAHLSWVLVKHWPLKTPKPLIDYAAINAAERTLGFVQSDYRAFGVEPVDVVADTDKLIAEIDYQLLPEDERKRLEAEKKIASTQGIPPSSLGKVCNRINDLMKHASTIQPMDEPYPVVKTTSQWIHIGDGWQMQIGAWQIPDPHIGYYDHLYGRCTVSGVVKEDESVGPSYSRKRKLIPDAGRMRQALGGIVNYYDFHVDELTLITPYLHGDSWRYQARVSKDIMLS